MYWQIATQPAGLTQSISPPVSRKFCVDIFYQQNQLHILPVIANERASSHFLLTMFVHDRLQQGDTVLITGVTGFLGA